MVINESSGFALKALLAKSAKRKGAEGENPSYNPSYTEDKQNIATVLIKMLCN